MGAVRLEARRAREQNQTRVEMPIPGDRFAVILRWTLFKRSLAWWKYALSISTPMYLRPASNAAAHVLPLPAKGSSAVSPGSVKLRIKGTSAGIGFCVG